MDDKEIQFIPDNLKWILTDIEIEKLLLGMNIDDISNAYRKTSTFRTLCVYSLSALRILFYYFGQLFIKVNNKNSIAKLILESGRGYDTNNISKIVNTSDNNVCLLYAFDLKEYMKYEYITLTSLIGSLTDSIKSYNIVLKAGLPADIINIVLKNGPVNISSYAYLTAFFLKFRMSNPNCTVYTSGALLQSHASIASNLKTVLFFHGLIDKLSINVFPSYNSIYVYSNDEKKYLKSTGIMSKLHLYRSENVDSRTKKVIFFMADDKSIVDFNKLISLIELFNVHGYSIYIKSHPLKDASEILVKEYDLSGYNWGNFLDLKNINFIDGKDASAVMKKIRPSFSVSWTSTSICESINMGVIPINMLKYDFVTVNPFGVYPFHKRSLCWLNEGEIIEGILLGNTSYDDKLNMLKNR
jgi:hypothetical protein